ncbi:pirin family protein [Sulfurimonas sp. MAG313]|nr:pirin family protein [Sulfurimonas sp. MAG313]MDF1881979.1 pirin family protein [Sulfurimonas sp. MAG313]
MSILKHLKKDEQELMPLFNGAFIENKPIPFPNFEGTTAYSNIFYWAHLEAKETSEFPLHPHEGFEIMTFVFKGSLEHFDTATKVWTPMNEGGLQVIQAGSGVQHAERIVKGTRLFQIWFDPDFSKSLLKEAAYKDYPKESFKIQKQEGREEIHYIDASSAVLYETQGLEISKTSYLLGEYSHKRDKDFMYSYYLLEGKMMLNGVSVEKDSFLVEEDVENTKIEVLDKAELFMIKTPKKVDYKRFIQRY